jgi:MYXO-CTERM domain-containing protein
MRHLQFRWTTLAITGALLTLLPMCAHDAAPTTGPAPPPAGPPAVGADAARDALGAVPLGEVTSRDAAGRARLVQGVRDAAFPSLGVDAETAARLHLARHSELLGVSEPAIVAANVTGTHAIAGGASIVQLAQRVAGVEVFRARASVVLDAQMQMVSIASTLHPSGFGDRLPRFASGPEAAIAAAYTAQHKASLAPSAVADTGARTPDTRGYKVATAAGAPRIVEATAKRVLFPEGMQLRAAHYVELVARQPGSKQDQAWAYVIGDDGRALYSASLTANDFNYRVWADPAGNHIPLDGPMADYSPHPTGVPDKLRPGFVAPAIVSTGGFNTNPSNQPDPWLKPTDTVSFGNNVQAYTDRTDDGTTGDGYDPAVDVQADLTAALTFDRTYDVTAQPNVSVAQEKASVAQIFYTTNWLHDYWYDSGFNEASGNGQLVNYGRGGLEGDPLHAEAQDGADKNLRNNANMSAMSDGTSPRMQMYEWSGITTNTLTWTPAVATTDGEGNAAFGPTAFDVTAGSTVTAPTNGCTALSAPVTGKIAVIDRGACTFKTKVLNAQNAGAVGVVIVNSVAGHVAPNMGDDATITTAITIPTLSISLEDGALVKAGLAAGPQTAHMASSSGVLQDGTIDNTVVAHEWGHYLHHRLVNCGSQSCGGMSEGWADFNALMMVMKAGDTYTGTAWALAQYASQGLLANNEYFGIRRAPYSTDKAKNPFTFTHVRAASTLPTGAPLSPAAAAMNEVHNVGEIWAETLFEGYVNMLTEAGSARTFDQTKRALANYVVAGMKATPVEPTFTDQRDAILSTVWATGQKTDFTALVQGFAKRGLGIGAVAPPVTSTNLNEAVEDFTIAGKLAFVDGKVDDSVVSCDHDGVLDAGESGKLTLRVKNIGWVALAGTTVNVTTTAAGVTIGSGGAATITSIDPYGVATVTLDASLDKTVTGRQVVTFTVNLANAASFNPTLQTTALAAVNYDDVPNYSSTDDVESEHPVETFGHGAVPANVWSRKGDPATGHVWHGDDFGITTDESLVTPSLTVHATNPLTIAFSHRYGFEHGADPVTPANQDYYDGGVLEVSLDNGATWVDISTYVDPAYTQTVFSYTPNPDPNVLAGRKAWAGDSAGYPAFTNVVLNVGTALAGKTIKLRFRIGTDSGGSAVGWDIDNLAIGGITNTPFPAILPQAACTLPADGGVEGGTDGGNDGGIDTDGGTDGGVSDAGDGGAEGGVTDGGSEGGVTDGGSDAGKPRPDAGQDSGTPTNDSGTPDNDSGTPPVVDSGTPGTDSGADAGAGGGGGDNSGCGCVVGPGAASSPTPVRAGAFLFVGALALLRRRRRAGR